jgi:diguanylate cyclase (GGDEF)-like protein
MRILLIEDDEALGEILQRSLTQHHYAVDRVNDGQKGWNYAQSAEYDLILLDVGLPKLDGISLCERLRSQGCATPILLMTAKDATTERIKGLDAGADDYLIKPLDVGELQARVRALLRRKDSTPAPILEIAGLQLDPSRGQVSYREQVLKLTPKEYGLLELFLRNPTRLFSRGQIIEHLWTFEDIPSEESVKAHIKGLRQKLKQVGGVNWIENIYGMGYRLNPPIGKHALLAEAHTIEPPHPTTESDTAMRSPVEAQFDQAVAGLWQQYQDMMCQRMDLLHQAAIACQSAQILIPDLRQAAAQAVHKLAGVLGMFGKDEGTSLSRAIEHLLTEDAPDLHNLPTLVQQLDTILNLPNSAAQPPRAVVSSPTQSTPPTLATPTQPYGIRVLLIAVDPKLTAALQQLSAIAEIQWQSFSTPQQAQVWLKDHTPSLLITELEHGAAWGEQFRVMAELAARTPSVPTVVITATTDLSDRVAIAQAGGQRILPASTPAAQVWETITPLLQRFQSVNVLAVDDDPIFLDALPPLLEPWGIRVMGVSEPETFWTVLEAHPPDLLLLDVEMPHFNGIELCHAVRADLRWQDLPILFVTARRDRHTIQQVFAAGADDYITKPIVGSELITRMTQRLDRMRWLQTLQHQDPLTGLVNQPHAQRLLERLLEQSARSQGGFSFVRVAIANLHRINCQYGHVLGNQVLRQSAQVLRSQLRGAEMFSYWGNGEFVILLPALKVEEAELYLGEALRRLRQQVFTDDSCQDNEVERFQAEVQWGMAEYPGDGETVRALYQASHNLAGILLS